MVLLLKSNDYYTQRNNLEKWRYRSCMASTRAMFYKANNIEYTNPTEEADDDYFMGLLNTQEAKDFCYKQFPWAYNSKEPEKSIWPNEVHGMYNQYLDKLVCGKKVSSFENQALDWNYFVNSIQNKKAIMVSGTFGDILGHAVLVMGYDEVTNELIIADPYGDFHSSYKNPKGYGIRMSYNDFNTHIKPVDSFLKNGHIVI